MNMHTSYPVFESGQVLSSGHLNDLVNYLEEQDRLTRNKLIGIGVACGFAIDYDAPAKHIRLSRGCAVTSAGFLIFDEASTLDRFRPYTVPMPHLEETPPEVLDEARYPFFFGANNQQISLWELLPTDYVPAPGEPVLTTLTDAFLANKVLLLFLESNLESLKNCDINDCSDKGAERNLTLRKLLITKADAQKILDREKEIAGKPVDRSTHPGLGLVELSIEKIHLARYNVTHFQALHQRIVATVSDLWPRLQDALSKSYEAYAYLLRDLYPAGQFPNGPFGAGVDFGNVVYQYSSNQLLIQYLYDVFLDVAQAYNEFLRAAFRMEAECCPNPDRFPRHVLLGEIKPQPIAFLPQSSDWSKFDHLKADTGVGPSTAPAAFRHHFIPSKLDRHHAGLREVQTLHYRLYLLAFRYRVDDLMKADLRITPSRTGDYPLSDKAVPFYYGFKFGDDLHRCWSFAGTTGNRLDQVYSYQFIDPAKHPLANRMERHNFYRVEGIVGKPLGQAMEQLKKLKQELGLSMGIAPVLLDVGARNDVFAAALNREAQVRGSRVMRNLLACRMGEMDLFFLTTMGMLASYLFSVVSLLARLNTTHVAAAPPPAKIPGTQQSRVTMRVAIDRKKSEATLKNIRSEKYVKGTLTDRELLSNDPKQSVGQLYTQIKSSSDNSNLSDRTREFVAKMGSTENIEVVTRKVYLPIALLEQTEDLIETIRAPSIAEFDFDKFDAKYEGFSKAFDAYQAEASLDEKADPALVAANQTLIASYGAIAGSAPQLILANIAKDFRERLDKLFDELTVENYARKNPGMEHRCGVPVGGTLILLCTHKRFLAEVLGSNSELLDGAARELQKKLAPNSPRERKPNTEVKTLLGTIASATTSQDELIVVADFCVPYLCCDADCSEVDFPPSGPAPDPAIVKGTVFGRTVKDGVPSNPAPLKAAAIAVTSLDKGVPIKSDFADGNYAFTAPPGTHRIEVTAKGFPKTSRIITTVAGSNLTEDFVLTAS